MSDTGLHAGFHDQVRFYARQVDALLIELRTHAQTAGSEAGKQTARLIQQLREPTEAHDLTVQLLAFAARRRGLFQNKQWSEFADDLCNARIMPGWLDRLETLARFLEDQRAGAVAKMRGR